MNRIVCITKAVFAVITVAVIANTYAIAASVQIDTPTIKIEYIPCLWRNLITRSYIDAYPAIEANGYKTKRIDIVCELKKQELTEKPGLTEKNKNLKYYIHLPVRIP